MRILKKIILILIIIVGLVVGLVAFVGFYLSPQSGLSKSDVIVAISGGETQARAKEAISLYKDGWSKKIIFSGAAEDKDSISNAEAMQRIAIWEQVPPEDIIIEEKSANTYENAQMVKPILEENDYKKIILVTSPYHQRRAYLCFKKFLGDGYEILNHSAKDSSWRRSKWWENKKSLYLTYTEFSRVIYILATGKFD